MIPRGFFFDHNCLAGGIQTRQKDGGFHLRAGHGQGVAHGNRVGSAHNRHGQTPAFAPIGLRAKQRQRVGHPPHRPFAQAGVAREGGGDRRGRHRAHYQPHTCAGIAAVNHIGGFGKATHAHALHAPRAGAVVRDGRAKGLHRLGGIQHILAFQQAGDGGFANRHGPEDQSAVADRLVARHSSRAFERAGFVGGHRLGGAVGRHGKLLRVE